MKRLMMILGLALAVGVCPAAKAADDPAALKKRRETLQAQRDAVLADLDQIRKTVEKSDAAVAAQKALSDARLIYQAKIAESERASAAKKAMDEAAARVKGVIDAELASSPETAAAQKEIDAADDVVFDAQSQLRIAEFILGEMRRKTARLPDLNGLKAADHAATEAYYAARKSGQDVKSAKAAQDAAEKALDDAIAARLAASPEGKGQHAKIEDLRMKLKAARTAMEASRTKLSETRRKVASSNAKVAEARKAVDAADESYHDVLNDEAGAERDKVEQAARALNDAITAKLEDDPKVMQLRKQADTLKEQIKAVGARVKSGK